MWSRVRDFLGTPAPGPTGVVREQFNAMWSTAVSMREATDAFGRALAREERYGRPVQIPDRAYANAPWSRDLTAQNTLPIYQINFTMTLTDPAGQSDTGWFTTIVRGALPGDAGALAQLVTADAQQMADRYGKSFGGIGDIQILTV